MACHSATASGAMVSLNVVSVTHNMACHSVTFTKWTVRELMCSARSLFSIHLLSPAFIHDNKYNKSVLLYWRPAGVWAKSASVWYVSEDVCVGVSMCGPMQGSMWNVIKQPMSRFDAVQVPLALKSDDSKIDC